MANADGCWQHPGDRGCAADLDAGSAQYRRRYASPESALASACTGCYEHVAVVPLCAEPASCVDGFVAAMANAGGVLLIMVVNGRADAAPAVHARNERTFADLDRQLGLREVDAGAWWGGEPATRVLVVDRFSPGRRMSPRQGVGLARRIGADIALELIAGARVRSPFIAMVDADARLPDDYFGRVATLDPQWAAGLFPFWHEPGGDRDVDRATALYELRLRYQQRGLAWAGSPYAFHSIGSTMVVHALRYAQVRGMPMRQAAEDFHLLDKLAKVRPLARVTGEPVRIRSRVSDRVPFGTGAETARLVAGGSLTLYHPACFAAVADVVRCARDASRNAGSDRAVVDRLLSALPAVVSEFLVHQGARDVWPSLLAQCRDEHARLRRLHTWFDGLRTLKLMHHVRDRGAVSLGWQEAVSRAPFMPSIIDDGACLAYARNELLRQEAGMPELVGPTIGRGSPKT